MEQLIINFITVLAWIFGVLATLSIVIRVAARSIYSDLDRSLDALRGVRKTFPIIKPIILAAICWAWIISF